jgi:hypothetical protein
MLTVWIGLTFGACAWAAIRGRGRLSGLAVAMVMGAIASAAGWLGADAMAQQASPGQLGLGATLGGLLAAVVIVVGWGPRPKITAVEGAPVTAAGPAGDARTPSE